MAGNPYPSWGRFPAAAQRGVIWPWRNADLPAAALQATSFLPRGNGRSYGDVCLNQDGMLLDCRRLDHFLTFDAQTGLIRCEGGVLLSAILRLVVPSGWFLPVTPGTRFVTVGGAIANDVHGKNHHRSGTFGCHVRAFELLRSDGQRLCCRPDENSDLYRATIGGLGLTGVITWAEIQLRPLANAWIDQEIIRYRALDEFFTLSRESDRQFDYTVAWIDCLARGERLGRGLFMRGNHAEQLSDNPPAAPKARSSVPLDPPFALVNPLTLRLFNGLYYHRQRAPKKRGLAHYESFFYPLDAVADWNRVYGPRGFFQYQCALPEDQAQPALHEILTRIAAAGTGSFLAVLKMFGRARSPGLISFPLPGVTLALDFPNQGARTLALLDSLDEVTRNAGGRVNPSKDARMSAADFQAGYPAWKELERLRDPRISSSFWRRVTS